VIAVRLASAAAAAIAITDAADLAGTPGRATGAEVPRAGCWFRAQGDSRCRRVRVS
jgi:hypothetical protein